MRFLLFLGVSILFSCSVIAQKNVNDYKYVVVPDKYDFLKENDAYQLNSLTKFLFKKYGFKALLQSEEKPEDLAVNGCKSLRVQVKNSSGFLKSKLKVELIDCNGQVVFMTSEGTSKEKDFKKSYHEALRNAFKDIEKLQYSYNGKADEVRSDKQPEVVSPEVKKSSNAVAKQEVVKNDSRASEKIPNKTNEPKLEINKASYNFNNVNYLFKKQSYGYELLKRDTSVGRIYTTSKENTFIIQAQELSGVGYFDAYGNFILERVNPATNKVIKDTFARQ